MNTLEDFPPKLILGTENVGGGGVVPGCGGYFPPPFSRIMAFQNLNILEAQVAKNWFYFSKKHTILSYSYGS